MENTNKENKCSNCGADISYDATKGQNACGFCGTVFAGPNNNNLGGGNGNFSKYTETVTTSTTVNGKTETHTTTTNKASDGANELNEGLMDAMKGGNIDMGKMMDALHKSGTNLAGNISTPFAGGNAISGGNVNMDELMEKAQKNAMDLTGRMPSFAAGQVSNSDQNAMNAIMQEEYKSAKKNIGWGIGLVITGIISTFAAFGDNEKDLKGMLLFAAMLLVLGIFLLVRGSNKKKKAIGR